jgi:hypothetical protein
VKTTQTGHIIRSKNLNRKKKWFKITGKAPGTDRLHLATVNSLGNACKVAMLFCDSYSDIEIE